MPDSISHREHRQTKRQGDARETDPELRERRRQHRTSAAAKYQPEGAKKFGSQLLCHRKLCHVVLLMRVLVTSPARSQIPANETCHARGTSLAPGRFYV